MKTAGLHGDSNWFFTRLSRLRHSHKDPILANLPALVSRPDEKPMISRRCDEIELAISSVGMLLMAVLSFHPVTVASGTTRIDIFKMTQTGRPPIAKHLTEFGRPSTPLNRKERN